jgi:hypothetical protein
MVLRADNIHGIRLDFLESIGVNEIQEIGDLSFGSQAVIYISPLVPI